LLGRHVANGSHRHAGTSQSCRRSLAGEDEGGGDAEIRQIDVPTLEEDVLGLHVAVDDALLMGG